MQWFFIISKRELGIAFKSQNTVNILNKGRKDP